MNKLKKELFTDKGTKIFLEQIAGPVAVDIVNVFNREGLSPEEISNKLNEKITIVRSALNSLHFRGIACYKKQRNENNIYEFIWEIKFKKIIDILLIQEIKRLKKIEYELVQKETHDYFECSKKCNVELEFEVSAAYNFKCPNCNSSLNLVNKKTKVASLKRKRTVINKNIKKLEKLLTKINENLEGYHCE